MDQPEPDPTLDALSPAELTVRLAVADWNHPDFVTSEHAWALFRRFNRLGDGLRAGALLSALSRRVLMLSRGFALRSGIYPSYIDNLEQAAEDLARYVFDCLVTRPADAEHAEKLFGQLFKRRALDFHRTLRAKKRTAESSLDAMDQEPEGVPESWSDPAQDPEEALATQQEHAQIAARLQAILTTREHATYVMLYVEDMQVKDIAAALGVTPRAVNNYKNAALQKIRTEFTQ